MEHTHMHKHKQRHTHTNTLIISHPGQCDTGEKRGLFGDNVGNRHAVSVLESCMGL